MIILDTSGLIALLNAEDRHHEVARRSFEESGHHWIVPWAVLPELDYLVTARMSNDVARAFLEDVRDGSFRVDAELQRDLPRAMELQKKYASLALGLVDTVVMAQAERHEASAILTTDGRHFRAVKLSIRPAPAFPLLDA
jgi:uncharacterized protein